MYWKMVTPFFLQSLQNWEAENFFLNTQVAPGTHTDTHTHSRTADYLYLGLDYRCWFNTGQLASPGLLAEAKGNDTDGHQRSLRRFGTPQHRAQTLPLFPAFQSPLHVPEPPIKLLAEVRRAAQRAHAHRLPVPELPKRLVPTVASVPNGHVQDSYPSLKQSVKPDGFIGLSC